MFFLLQNDAHFPEVAKVVRPVGSGRAEKHEVVLHLQHVADLLEVLGVEAGVHHHEADVELGVQVLEG